MDAEVFQMILLLGGVSFLVYMIMDLVKKTS